MHTQRIVILQKPFCPQSKIQRILIHCRFWDMRQLPTQASLATVQLGERVYCSDVLFPMGIVGLANRRMKVSVLYLIILFAVRVCNYYTMICFNMIP